MTRARFGRAARLAVAVSTAAVITTLVAAPGVSHAQGSMFYVSLGDSYSVGYQPSPVPGATSGYTGVVAAAKGLQLENFGCGGATTSSILTATGTCGTNGYGPPAATDVGPSTPSETQIQAADAFISANQGNIGLITVSIGGNDVTSCVSAASPDSCVLAAIPTIKANVTTLVGDLRAALGPSGKTVPIIGLSYPDVILGQWVNNGGTPTFPPSTANQSLAATSQFAFKSLINPALKTAYKTGKAKLVDVTKKTGAYTKLTKTTSITLAPFGMITVPKAVAEVCNLTWYCQLGNIHANTAGYTLIGNLIDAAVK